MPFLKRGNDSIWIKEITNIERQTCHYDFYRSRTLKTTNVDDLKHIPFDKLYLTSSQRFTLCGCADLYLSYTREACEREIGNDGTIAKFVLKNNSEIKVFDMSAYELNSSIHFDDKNTEQLMIMWPLIATCNSIACCCPVNKHECKELNRKFKIEYVIPQMFASYLKSRNIADGIRYYTVRDENLNPRKIDMMDIVLFTTYSHDSRYDDQLLNKFEISISE